MQLIRLYNRTILYGIFCLVLVLFVGYALQLKIEKETIRSSVKALIFEGLNRSQLIFISTEKQSDPSFSWKDEGEFMLNGRFYDIVETIDDQEQQGFWCWLDEEESEIEEKINRLYALKVNTSESQKKRNLVFQNFMNSLYFHPLNVVKTAPVITAKLPQQGLIEAPINRDRLPDFPPPKSC